jgi:hypothetical protein
LIQGTVVGWGSTDIPTGSPVTRQLSKATVTFISNQICKEQLTESEIPLNITEGMICAGTRGKRSDACKGDSGGALLCTSPGDDTPVLCGVVSFGGPCGFKSFDVPTVYTRVSYYVDWIDQHSRDILSGGKCPRNEVICGGQCIHYNLTSQSQDCATKVTEVKKCRDGQFACSSYQGQTKCIPSSYVCDRDFDCPNRDDEENCLPPDSVTTTTTVAPSTTVETEMQIKFSLLVNVDLENLHVPQFP